MHDFTLDLPSTAAAASWLARAIPHLSTDDTLPMLGCVQITIGDGHLLAIATDRYTLAVSRLDTPTGTLRGTFTVPGSWARAIAESFDDEPGYGAAALTLRDGSLRFEAVYDDEPCTPITATVDEYDPWRPGWRALLAQSLDHPASSEPAIVSAELLTRFAPRTLLTIASDGTVSLTADIRPLPYTVHVPGDLRPVALISHDLIGIIAVQRTRAPQVEAEATDPRETWAPILAPHTTRPIGEPQDAATPRLPIAATPQWLAATSAADWQCQCTTPPEGTAPCGHSHRAQVAGRCQRTGRGPWAVRLILRPEGRVCCEQCAAGLDLAVRREQRATPGDSGQTSLLDLAA